MASYSLYISSVLLVLVNIFSTLSAWHLHKCADDFSGTSSMAFPIKLERMYLKPYSFDYQEIVQAPNDCYRIKGILAHACSSDIAPLVQVSSLKEVNVHRSGALYKDIFIDITVYCELFLDKTDIPIPNKPVP